MSQKSRAFFQEYLSIVLTLGFFASVILLATYQNELREFIGSLGPALSAAKPEPGASRQASTPAPQTVIVPAPPAVTSSPAASPSTANPLVGSAPSAGPSTANPLVANTPSANKPSANSPASKPPAAAPPTAPASTNLPTVVRLGTGPSAESVSALDPGRIRIVSGDTVLVDGRGYSLVGIDPPESGKVAKCDRERELAERAVRRLREIVTGGGLRFDRVACPCPAGTEGTLRCNAGRLCGVLTAAGRDVSLILVGEGLAHRNICSGSNCPPKPGWCS